MYFKIHRGTKEIGGSCVEVWTQKTRILIDFGMPLITKDGSEFNFAPYKHLNTSQLVEQGILPDINGLYEDSQKLIDAVIISHPHQDHYGLINFINKNIKCFLGEASHKLIEIGNIFLPQKISIPNCVYFEKEIQFRIGDITITPYWADHSAFDSYSFLVESEGKSLFYSGDFRSHGRKANAFKWFTNNAPENVDYLLLEGTSIGRDQKPFKTETEIENELTGLFSQPDKINLVYTSGQNIDRLVSIYRACKKANKILVMDVYVATILNELSKFARLPFPSNTFPDIKVLFAYLTSRGLKQKGYVKILYVFKNFKITKKQISSQPASFVIIVRPSMKKDLNLITGIEGGNLIYSMWDGYLSKSGTKEFVDYLTGRKFTLHKIHTSGHADIHTLKQLGDAVRPKHIVPIHTFNGSEYKEIFSAPVVELNDCEIRQI